MVSSAIWKKTRKTSYEKIMYSRFINFFTYVIQWSDGNKAFINFLLPLMSFNEKWTSVVYAGICHNESLLWSRINNKSMLEFGGNKKEQPSVKEWHTATSSAFGSIGNVIGVNQYPTWISSRCGTHLYRNRKTWFLRHCSTVWRDSGSNRNIWV